jgi:hypothetical protein
MWFRKRDDQSRVNTQLRQGAFPKIEGVEISVPDNGLPDELRENSINLSRSSTGTHISVDDWLAAAAM